MKKNNRVVVVQIGARMHYAVPIILYRMKCLVLFITDYYHKGVFTKVRYLINSNNLIKISGRQTPELENNKVVSNNWIGILYKLRMIFASRMELRYKIFIWIGKAVNIYALKELKKIENLFDSIYVFNTAGFELMKHYKGRKYLILEQCIAVQIVEQKLIKNENERHPDWQNVTVDSEVQLEYIRKEIEELYLADLILCPSTFVKDSVLEIDRNFNKKIKIVPYGVPTLVKNSKRREYSKGEVLQVLTVGNVGLRKGTPYILEAAKHFQNEVRFTIVGDYSLVSDDKVVELRNWVDLIGQVPRSTVSDYYNKAHVFLLPSVCEGSATVTYEAMQYGLPLIVTPNTGSIVRNGIDGFIISNSNLRELIFSIQKLLDDPTLISYFSKNSQERSFYASLQAYEERLSIAIN